MKTVTTSLIVAALLYPTACSTPRSVAIEKLEPYQCGTVKRIHTLGSVFLASQPQPEDFEHASQGGIQTVVNLRKASEVDWDEPSVVADLGMQYHSVPFKSPEELTDAVFDEVRKLLNDAENKPLLLHCASANRVGAVWLAHRVLDHGLSFEDAEAEAKTVGLKLPAYTERAREYVSKQRADSAE